MATPGSCRRQSQDCSEPVQLTANQLYTVAPPVSYPRLLTWAIGGCRDIVVNSDGCIPGSYSRRTECNCNGALGARPQTRSAGTALREIRRIRSDELDAADCQQTAAGIPHRDCLGGAGRPHLLSAEIEVRGKQRYHRRIHHHGHGVGCNLAARLVDNG